MTIGPRSVDDHLATILDAITPLSPYDQPLLDAAGLPLCEDVRSPIALPRFPNSSMDGYAVRHVDVAEAASEAPVHLPVVGESAAGSSGPYGLPPGTAMRIMTGAPLPSGADSVVPIEWTNHGTATVQVRQPPELGQHVRHTGEDVAEGELLLEEGTLLGPREIGLLAGVGRPRVRARPRPRVVVLSTGNELRDPGQPLGFDSIYDANSYLLAASVRAAGAIPYRVGVVGDDPHTFSDALSDQLVRADVVVTSGGVSKGAYDVVKDVLSRLGTVEFCEVAMQPGKPQGFGHVGEDVTPIFTLPGNPVSSYVSFEVFCVPALRRLMGRQPYRRPLVQAVLTQGVASMRGRRQFLRARFDMGHLGATVTPVGGAGSHLLGGLAHSNALVVIGQDVTAVAADDTVSVLVLDRDF
ncbi:MAG: molybdopterin molybdotransferase MoeA [Nocardioidaceae bacterium]|nr:molybdopterin molybdotransferase MoeA [Nocardioidaceae bacterium]